MGFTVLESDQSVFVKFTKEGVIFILIYIDNLLITSSSKKLVMQFKIELAKYFDFTNKGEVERFLRTNIICHLEEIYLFQEDYVVKIMLKYNLLDLNSVLTFINERLVLVVNLVVVSAS